MSHKSSSWAAEQVLGSPFGKCILFMLADCSDNFGICYPSPEYISQICEVSRASVFRWLKIFASAGMVQRIDTQTRDGLPVKGYKLSLEQHFDLTKLPRFEKEEIVMDDGESHPETRESLGETQKSHGDPVGVSLCDSNSLIGETHNPLANPRFTIPKPLSPAELPKAQQEGTRKTHDLTEPIGFRSWFENYLGWQTMDRTMALREYVGLSEPDRDKLTNATPRYLSDCARLRKPPKSAHLFARRRDGRALFENYGSGAMAAQAGPRLLIRDGTDAYQAWCAFYAVAFGGEPKIPRHLVDPTVRGAWVNAEWPPGGSGWIVPREEWLFVEKWTPQYMAWCKRVTEVIARPPVIVRAREHHHRMRLIGTHGNDWIATHTYDGLIVPREFPPAKSSPQESQQEASLATDDDLQHFAETPVCH